MTEQPIYTYISNEPLFRSLTGEEELKFRVYARDNNPPDMENWEIYHPVCRDEWMRRGIHP